MLFRSGGGVAILIPDHQKNDAVQVYSGVELEVIAVRLNNYNPPLCLICCYGAQEYHKNVTEYGMTELDNLISSQLSQGVNILLGGDINAWIGDAFNVKGNNDKVNKPGKALIEIINKYNLFIGNSLAKRPTTDRKSTRLNSSHSQQSRMPSSA